MYDMCICLCVCLIIYFVSHVRFFVLRAGVYCTCCAVDLHLVFTIHVLKTCGVAAAGSVRSPHMHAYARVVLDFVRGDFGGIFLVVATSFLATETTSAPFHGSARKMPEPDS